MNRFKKIVLLSFVLIIPLFSLVGCTKVSLTGSTGGAPTEGEMGIPPDGGTPPEGNMPPLGDAPAGGLNN